MVDDALTLAPSFHHWENPFFSAVGSVALYESVYTFDKKNFTV